MKLNPKNIIVRMPNWIGDLVMATPILQDLRERFPLASITAMCVVPLCELLKENRYLNEVFCFERPRRGFFRRREKRDIIERLKEGRYDLGILLPNSFSSAWWFWQGGVKLRLGYFNISRFFFLNIPVFKKGGQKHLIKTYKRLLKPLGIKESSTLPSLFLAEEEREIAKELLFQRGYKRGKKLIGISPSAAYGETKCWPKERYAEIAERLLKDQDVFVVFFGDERSVFLVKEICKDLNERAINLAGLTSLRELMALISWCTCLLTNDSGPMHIASALKVPVVALFGSTSEVMTGPYHKQDVVIHKEIDCSPCFERECKRGIMCMQAIEVDEVFEIMKEKVYVKENNKEDKT